jgi:hypothetical protein
MFNKRTQIKGAEERSAGKIFRLNNLNNTNTGMEQVK